MESDDERGNFDGSEPEFGAIFMSSRATKNECLRRRLFGLPSVCGRFVRQVKTGMILFLFEYESRQLHGVFQACSDGEMNIFPRAYNSSGKGKQFPAQVKIKSIWDCHPLSESEFSDAIKENYFRKSKFRFGLSKSQVRRLLTLFNSRKIKDLRPEGDIARRRARLVSNVDEVREVDDGMSVSNDEVNNELGGDNNTVPMMTQYPENSFWNVGKEDHGNFTSGCVYSKDGEIIQSAHLRQLSGEDGRGDTKLAMCERPGDELKVDIAHVKSTPTEFETLNHSGRSDDDLVMLGRAGRIDCPDAEIRPATLMECPGYPSAQVERVQDDARFLMTDKVQDRNSEGNVFGPAISVDYPAFSESSFHAPVCSVMPVQETEYSGGDQTRSTATLSHQMEMPVTNHFDAGSFRDGIVTSALHHYPDAPSPNVPCSPLIEVNQSSSSVEECFDPNDIRSLTNQVSPLCLEPEGIHRSLDVHTSKFDCRVPFACPDHHEHSCPGSIMPLSGAVCSEEITLQSSRQHAKGVFSSTLAPGTLAQVGSIESESKSPSSYSLSPSNNHPVALQNNLEHEIAQNANYEPSANITSSEELQSQLQSHVHPGDCDTVDHHENFDGGFNSYETSEGRSSVLPNNRSVFSRLKVNPDMPVKKNSMPVVYDENYKDTSVDEIMAALTESRYPWVQSKKSDVHCRWDETQLEVLKKSKMASVTPVEDTDDPIREEIPFVDFKRRSELRKVDIATKATAIDESVGNAVPGGQRKRRKLIRPNFINSETCDDKSTCGKNSPISPQASSRESSVNEDDNGKRRKLVRQNIRQKVSCGDKCTNQNAYRIYKGSSQQFSVAKDSTAICQDSVGRQDTLVRQGSELSHVVQSCLENENIETERSAQYQREAEVESSGAAMKICSQDQLLRQVSEQSHGVYQSSQENQNTEEEISAKFQRETEVESHGLKVIGSQDNLLLQGGELSRTAHQSSHENETIQTERYAKYEKETQVESSGATVHIGSRDKLLLRGSDLLCVVDHRSQVNENIETERFVKYKRDTQGESSEAALKVGDVGGKETLHDAGSQIGSLAISCKQNDQKDSSNKVADKNINGSNSLISEPSSQESSDSQYVHRRRRKLVRPSFGENKPCDDKCMNGNTSSFLASSQESSDREYANGKRRKLVWPNLREKKPCTDKSTNENTSMILQVSSHLCSISEDANKICQDSAGSQDKLEMQGTELPHVVYDTIPDNENTETESAPKYERERKVKNPGTTLRIGDKGGNDSVRKVGSQIAEGNIPNAEKDSYHKHPIINRLSQDCHVQEPALQNCHVQESALQIPRPKIECGRGNERELFSGVELSSNKCVIRNGNLTCSLMDLNSGLQKVATEVASRADTCIGDNHHGSSRIQSEAPLDTVGCFDKQEPSQEDGVTKEVASCANACVGDKHGSSPKQSEAPLDTVSCFDKQEPSLEHGLAKEIASCAEACIGDSHHGSSPKQSEAPLETLGCFDKQEPSQEHRSSNRFELSSGTVSPLDKLEACPEGRGPNVHFGESLFLLSTGCKSDVLSVSGRNICTSSGIGTSDDVEDDKKDVLQHNGGTTKRKLKRACQQNTVLADEFEFGRDVCATAGIGTSGNVEDKKDVLQDKEGSNKRKLKRACTQNTRLASEFDSSSDDSATVECKRENQRLWHILTSKLIEMKNAQQQ